MSETLEARIRRKAKEQPDKEALVIPADIVELLDERDATIAALRQSGGGDAPKWWEEEKESLIEEIEVLSGQLRRANAPQAGAVVQALFDEIDRLQPASVKEAGEITTGGYAARLALIKMKSDDARTALAALKGAE